MAYIHCYQLKRNSSKRRKTAKKIAEKANWQMDIVTKMERAQISVFHMMVGDEDGTENGIGSEIEPGITECLQKRSGSATEKICIYKSAEIRI